MELDTFVTEYEEDGTIQVFETKSILNGSDRLED